MTGWRRLGAYALGLACGEVAAGYLAYWLNEAFRSNLRGPDFFTYYAIARLQLERGPWRAYDLSLQKQYQDQVTSQWPGSFILLPHILPPYFTLPIAPIGLLPFRTAYVLWGMAVIAMLALSVAILLRAAGIRGRAAVLFALLAAAFLPAFVLLLQGQSDGPALVGLAVASWFWTRGHDGRAGAAAALTLVKPHLLVLLPVMFIAQRSWRALAAYGGAAGAMVLATLPFFGVEGWRAYLAVVLPWVVGGHQGFPVQSQASYSLRGLAGLLPTGQAGALAVTAVLFLSAAALLTRRPHARRLDFALAVATSLALSPYQNPHDLSLLVVPLIVAGGMLLHGELRLPAAGWAALALCYAACEVFLATGPYPAAAAIGTLALYLAAERVLSLRPQMPSAVRNYAYFWFTGPAGGRSRTK